MHNEWRRVRHHHPQAGDVEVKIQLAKDNSTAVTLILGEAPNTVAVRLQPGGSVTVEETEEALFTIVSADLHKPETSGG